MTRTIGSYTHSDAVTQNKGAALAVVRLVSGDGDSDKASDFANHLAKLACGTGASIWADVIAIFPDLEDKRTAAGCDVVSLHVARLERGESGRVMAVVDGDRGVVFKAISATDFAARTDEFKAFADRVASELLSAGEISQSIVSEAQGLGEQLREQVGLEQVEIIR